MIFTVTVMGTYWLCGFVLGVVRHETVSDVSRRSRRLWWCWGVVVLVGIVGGEMVDPVDENASGRLVMGAAGLAGLLLGSAVSYVINAVHRERRPAIEAAVEATRPERIAS